MTNEHENPDEPIQTFDEDAFFDDEENTSSSHQESMTDEEDSHLYQEESFADKLKAWAFPIVVGGGIVLFGAYKLYGMFSGGSTPAAPSAQKENPVSALKHVATHTETSNPDLPPESKTHHHHHHQSEQTAEAANAPTPADATQFTENATPAAPDAPPDAVPGMAKIAPPKEAAPASVATPNASAPQSAQVDALQNLFDTDENQNQTAPIATQATQDQTYKALNHYWEQSQATETATTTLEKQIEVVQTTASHNETQVQNLLTDVDSLDTKVDDMSSIVNKLTTSLGNLEKTLTSLNSEVVSLKQMQEHQNTQLTDLSNQLSGFPTLTQSAPKSEESNLTQSDTSKLGTRHMPDVNQPHKQTAVVPAAPEHPAQSSMPSEASAANEFIIEAVIPGRAWLRTSDGMTITVTEGDTLGNLGKVVMIDAQNSSVVTASGVVLRN